MANLLLLIAAVFVAGVATSTACDTGKMGMCLQKLGQIASDPKNMCKTYKEVTDCLAPLNCPLPAELQQTGAMCGGQANSQGGPVVKSGQMGQGGCDITPCLATPEANCQKYTCLSGVKATCSAEDWAKVYVGMFKTKYDENAKNCASVNAGGNMANACSQSECSTKKTDCDKYNCFVELKSNDKCTQLWESMLKTNAAFKKEFAKMEEKCGCSGLNASILFTLVSSVLMFLRSHF